MRLARLIVTFFYIGHAKIAPGSIASLFTTLIFYLLAKHLTFYFFIIIILLTIILAFFAVSVYNSKSLKKDRSEIVIDEVIGQSIALLPLLLFEKTDPQPLFMCIISLLFFRFFDIVKPYPINKFDKMNNTFGVIFDDILAGIFSALFLIFVLSF
ncbi:phosphatidylglycerophosphatase A [Paracoccaceae bacterium]|nr:phosphatidylglycerophosphatase A [Paracoccaceae bacterium]